ncbi:cobalamin-binding protein, partial [Anoxybacillus geothermalis]|nr:cobalamin-binding protein [Anoxybacillus geothermalis]
RPHAGKTEAVRTGRIHVLEEALYCRPSPRLLIGLKKLAPLLHPALFPPADGSDPLLGR